MIQSLLKIKTSSSSLEMMCSGPIMDPSPAFPNKLDAGLIQDAAAKPTFQKDTVLL